MRRAWMGAGLAAGMLSVATAGFAVTSTGPGGGDPPDPTAGYANLLPANDAGAYAGVGFYGNGGAGVAGAVGTDDNGVGRGALFADPEGGGFYGEDYTPGDVIANGVEQFNEASGCPVVAGPECDPATDSAHDAILVTEVLPAVPPLPGLPDGVPDLPDPSAVPEPPGLPELPLP